MREIKFKAIYSLQKRWIFGSVEFRVNDEYTKIHSIDGCSTFQVEKESVCQYTGCKDINDVDIYEGDICEFDLGYKMLKCAVYFKDGCFYLNENDGVGDIQLYYLIHEIKNSKIKVIGNIHDESN